MKAILFLHRYLAIAVGLLMTLWCLSGFVMMYQSYPSLSSAERLAGLEPLNLTACCELTGLAQDDLAAAPAFRVEMLLGEPVLRLGGSRGQTLPPLKLRSGLPLQELSREEVLQVARRFGTGNGIAGEPRRAEIIDIDQWTIQSARRNQPAWKVAFDDPAGTQIYISGRSGEVFQDSNRRERVLSWLGAIPHWLYPTVLRQNGALWAEVVIWTSVAGTFLAATGLYVGIARLRRRKGGALGSPFRGWWYWHHVSGLLFGVLTLTWVFSGLMTMGPWGTLSSGGGPDYRSQLSGSAQWGEVKAFLGAMQDLPGDDAVRQLQSASFGARLHVLALGSEELLARLDAGARPTALAAVEVEALVHDLAFPVREFQLLMQEDAYHYGHKQDARLPVYRVLMDDPERTRLYIDPETGGVRSIDSAARLSRWIRTGLHGLDFPVLRERPFWDLAVILLLLGTTLVCATGTWMALRRVRSDWRRLRRVARSVSTRSTAGQSAASELPS